MRSCVTKLLTWIRRLQKWQMWRHCLGGQFRTFSFFLLCILHSLYYALPLTKVHVLRTYTKFDIFVMVIHQGGKQPHWDQKQETDEPVRLAGVPSREGQVADRGFRRPSPFPLLPPLHPTHHTPIQCSMFMHSTSTTFLPMVSLTQKCYLLIPSLQIPCLSIIFSVLIITFFCPNNHIFSVPMITIFLS